jgi:hypothetical protein
MLRFRYRQLFSMTAAELDEEPADQFFLNLWIYGLIKDKERLEASHG